MFKNIDTMKILDKIDVKSISSCFLLKNNSFQIEFIHSITQKKKFVVYTKNNFECMLSVKGLNCLMTSID